MLLSCEILKTLFNLTVIPSNEPSEENDYSVWIRLISILRDLLVTSTFVPEFQDSIVWYFLNIFLFFFFSRHSQGYNFFSNYYRFSNVVNLLTNVPPTCLDQLLIRNHWCDVDALKVVVNFLDNRLSGAEVALT